MNTKKDYIHKEFPKSCDPKDFFGQVKRTVNGKPITEEEIGLIVNTIKTNLDLQPKDFLFDIGCGNAALASMLFDSISGYQGVDFSEYLVKIAKENFEKPNYQIFFDDAISYIEKMDKRIEVTKILCYGVFSYFTPSDAEKLFALTRKKFPKATHFFIGNIPDKQRAQNFYYSNIEYKSLLDDNQSSIGKWWLKKEVEDLALSTGWDIKFHIMPGTFYSAHYRFDALITT